MSTLQLIKPRRAKQPVHRRIRHEGKADGGIYYFALYSMTHHGREIEHVQEVDVETGHVRCSCPDFMFRKAAKNPVLFDDENLCKHARRAVAWLQRHNLIGDATNMVTRCVSCGMPNPEHELCDDSGHPIPGGICADCVRLNNTINARRNYEPEPAVEYEAELV